MADNIKLITESLNKFGITNPNLQAGILATISKESEFEPKSENMRYSAKRIKEVWPNTSDAKAQQLASNPVALGNFMYGGKYGNSTTEGYKYRGRGFNQITFKDTYKNIGNIIGQDLVNNPDLLNEPKIAADAAAAYFRLGLTQGIKNRSFSKFGVTDLSAINDTTTATKVAIQTNAGLKTNFNTPVVQEGFIKAKNIVDSLYEKIKGYTFSGIEAISDATTSTPDAVKKKPLLTGLIVTGMAVALILIIRTIKHNGK